MINFLNGLLSEFGTMGLIATFFIGIGLSIRIYSKRQIKKKQSLIYQSYGIDQLLEDYGWKTVSFPIIGFGGDFYEPVQVHDLTQYQEKYFFADGWGAKYFIDTQGKKYTTNRVRLQDSKDVDATIGKFSFEKVIQNDTTLSFDTIKNDIITIIKRANRTKEGSVYIDQIKEFEQATTFQELVEIMDKATY